jgi:hypothetical protein
MKIFRIASMCMMIRIITLILLALPILFVISAAFGRPLYFPAVLLSLIYLWIWLRFRPSQFIMHQGGLEVLWPLKRRTIALESITGARIVNGRDLRASVGWGMRVGAGGLWGGFGWLWTERRGVVQMYISRISELVWIERGNERPWLISPERPEEFVEALSVLRGAAPPRGISADYSSSRERTRNDGG